MSTRPLTRFLPYAVAVLAIVLASMVVGLFSSNVALLIAIYVAAVAAVGWYGGFGPSLLATALSYVIANWFFVPARDAFHPTATVFRLRFRVPGHRRIQRDLEACFTPRAHQCGASEIDRREHHRWLCGRRSGVATDVHEPGHEEHNRRHFLDGSQQSGAGVFPLNLGPAAQARLKRAADDRQIVEFEDFYAPWQRWFDFKAAPTDEGGLAIYFRDITDRKRSEEEARKLASIIESSEDAVIGLDLSGNVTSWNQGAKKLYGYEAAEIVGRPVTALCAARADRRRGQNPGESPARRIVAAFRHRPRPQGWAADRRLAERVRDPRS